MYQEGFPKDNDHGGANNEKDHHGLLMISIRPRMGSWAEEGHDDDYDDDMDDDHGGGDDEEGEDEF